MESVQSGLRITTFHVSEEATTRRMGAAKAREALLEAVRAVPDDQLRNFRGGQILVVM
ncbi:MAG: hypothetical protein ACJ74U_18725 [Jatrophihabitantaceae bacterium]